MLIAIWLAPPGTFTIVSVDEFDAKDGPELIDEAGCFVASFIMVQSYKISVLAFFSGGPMSEAVEQR